MANTVHRRGVHHSNKKAHRKHKRPCRSAPAVPGNVELTFRQREQTHRKEWNARVSFDPVTVDVADRDLRIQQYQVQLQACNASGVALETHNGKPDTRSKTVHRGDDERAIFTNLAKPKVNYYKARVRAMTVDHHRNCWSAWSGWTDAVQPASGAVEGPPQPTGLSLTFDKVGGTNKNPFRALCEWNETAWWTPTDGDPLEGAAGYDVRLAVSNDGGDTTAHFKRLRVLSHDDDADTSASAQFTGIKRTRKYRASVRAFDSLGRLGAWSSWTSWKFPTADIGAGPSAPTNVTTTAPTPRKIRTTWEEPSDFTDVDRYLVTVHDEDENEDVEVVYTRSLHHRYDVPDDRKARDFTVTVISVDSEGNESDDDSDTATEGGTWAGTIIDGFTETVNKRIFISQEEFGLSGASRVNRGSDLDTYDAVRFRDGEADTIYAVFTLPTDYILGEECSYTIVYTLPTSPSSGDAVRWRDSLLVSDAVGITGSGTEVGFTDALVASYGPDRPGRVESPNTFSADLTTEVVRLSLRRNGTHGDDTWTGNVHVIGIEVTYPAAPAVGGPAGPAGPSGESNAPYKSELGAAFSDADFDSPSDGLLGVAHDTLDDRTYLYVRSNGAWLSVEAS